MAAGGIPSARELMRAMNDQGWRIEKTKSGHFKGFGPDGKSLVTFCDTDEPRSMKNNLAELRRTGQFQWPPPESRRATNDSGNVHALVPAATAAPQPSSPASPRRTGDGHLDDLFRNLKDAKAELTTMETKHGTVLEAVRQAEATLEEAKRRAERALAEAQERARRSQEDLDAARRLVMEAKAEFDAAFEGTAA